MTKYPYQRQWTRYLAVPDRTLLVLELSCGHLVLREKLKRYKLGYITAHHDCGRVTVTGVTRILPRRRGR